MKTKEDDEELRNARKTKPNQWSFGERIASRITRRQLILVVVVIVHAWVCIEAIKLLKDR